MGPRKPHTHEDPDDHSGYQTGGERIEVLERIFDENDRTAASNRADFARHGVCAINLMSSPGAGKTSLLEKTLGRLAGKTRVGVIEGDIATSLDADRLEGFWCCDCPAQHRETASAASAISTLRWCVRCSPGCRCPSWISS